MYQNQQKGFTLTELLIVMAILAVLASAGTLAYRQYIEGAKERATKQSLQNLSTAVRGYHSSKGQWPKKLRDVESLVQGQGDQDPFVDSWGNEFGYVAPTSKRDGQLTSYGADGTSGGGDDITYDIK